MTVISFLLSTKINFFMVCMSEVTTDTLVLTHFK